MSSSSHSSSEEKIGGLSLGMAKPGNFVANGFASLFFSSLLSLSSDTGFICCMIRSKLTMNESGNSAPFSMSAFLNPSKFGFLSAKSIMNSAVINQDDCVIKNEIRKYSRMHFNKLVTYLNLCRLVLNDYLIRYIF